MKASHLVSAVLALTPALFSLGCTADVEEAPDLGTTTGAVTAGEQFCVDVDGREQCITFSLARRVVELSRPNPFNQDQILLVRQFGSGFIIQDSGMQNCLDAPFFREGAEVLLAGCIPGETDPRAAAQIYQLTESEVEGTYLLQNVANPKFCIGTAVGPTGRTRVALVTCNESDPGQCWSKKQVGGPG